MEHIIRIKLDFVCLLIVSKIVVVAFKLIYLITLRDAELDHTEGSINMCFISTNKQPIILQYAKLISN